MPRPSSIRASSILRASVTLLAATGACFSGVAVDLGREVAPGDTSDDGPPLVEASVEAGDEAGPDASPPDDASPDDAPEGEPPETSLSGSALCIPNPSFEPGVDAAFPAGPEVAVPAGWTSCPGSATSVTPTSCVPPAAQGDTYLALSVGIAPLAPLNFPSSADAQLCAPMEAGVPYTLTAEVALDAPPDDSGASDEPPSLWVLGGNSTCDSQARFLLQFSPPAGTCGWRRLCRTFVPDQEYTHLVLIPEVTSGSQYPQAHVLVDDLRSGGSCSIP